VSQSQTNRASQAEGRGFDTRRPLRSTKRLRERARLFRGPLSSLGSHLGQRVGEIDPSA
jgi:hypothetical protein